MHAGHATPRRRQAVVIERMPARPSTRLNSCGLLQDRLNSCGLQQDGIKSDPRRAAARGARRRRGGGAGHARARQRARGLAGRCRAHNPHPRAPGPYFVGSDFVAGDQALEEWVKARMFSPTYGSLAYLPPGIGE